MPVFVRKPLWRQMAAAAGFPAARGLPFRFYTLAGYEKTGGFRRDKMTVCRNFPTGLPKVFKLAKVYR